MRQRRAGARQPLGTFPNHDQLIELFLTANREDRRISFVGTGEAAERLGLSPRTVRFWVDSGLLEAIHIGKKLWIYLPSLRACVKRMDAAGC